jgi:hypothetical protein
VASLGAPAGGGGGGGAALSDAVALADLTIAAAGTAAEAARADHRHPLGGVYHQKFRSGQIYSTLSTGIGTTALAGGYLWLSPFFVGETTTFNQQFVEITAAGAGLCRLGLYRDNASGYPGALFAEAGAVDVGTTGTKVITVNLVLEPGQYWLATLTETTTNASGRTTTGAATGMPTDKTTSGLCGYIHTVAAGSLPNPAPASMTAYHTIIRNYLVPQ